MASNLLGTTVEAVLEAVLEEAPSDLVLVAPPPDVVEGTVDALCAVDGPRPRVRVVAEEGVLKDVFEDFLVASRAADLVADDVLALRTATDLRRHSLLLTPDALVALVAPGDDVAGLQTCDDALVATAWRTYEGVWADAAPFSLRTPPLSAVRETLAEAVGPEVRAEFDAVLDAMPSVRGDDGLDEVTLSLLVAARNEVLLYDISKWGEDVGIASKATFSRTKTRLEDLGLIETEKVPIDVGRPRLRLRTGRDDLRDADPATLPALVRDRVAG